MDLRDLAAATAKRFGHRVVTVDSHTAGESTRTVVAGVPSLPGSTLQEQRRWFMEHHDDLRRRLALEPRGHRDLVVAVVTEPVTDDADLGLLIMDGRRYLQACGTATMGSVTALLELGLLPTGDNPRCVVVDTLSGLVTVHAEVRDGAVTGVGLQLVPSFVGQTGCTIHVPGTGNLVVDTVCVGGYFAMVEAEQAGLTLDAAHEREIVRAGMAVIEACNAQLEIRHPTRPDVRTVDVAQFYDPAGHGERRGRGAVVYGQAHLDRSPCGTATAAKLTLLHHRGEISIGEVFDNRGPLDTSFSGRIVEQTHVGATEAVTVQVDGRAHVTGVHEFVLDPDDPFPDGFTLGA